MCLFVLLTMHILVCGWFIKQNGTNNTCYNKGQVMVWLIRSCDLQSSDQGSIDSNGWSISKSKEVDLAQHKCLPFLDICTVPLFSWHVLGFQSWVVLCPLMSNSVSIQWMPWQPRSKWNNRWESNVRQRQKILNNRNSFYHTAILPYFSFSVYLLQLFQMVNYLLSFHRASLAHFHKAENFALQFPSESK